MHTLSAMFYITMTAIYTTHRTAVSDRGTKCINANDPIYTSDACLLIITC